MAALGGYTVGITADRRADEQAALFERRGARVMRGATIRTLPLADDDRLRDATAAVIEDPPDLVVLTTAIGTRSWLTAAESRGDGEHLLAALARATVITRGAKAKGAAVTAGINVAWSAPSARSREIVDEIIATTNPGSRIAIQLDGGANDRIAAKLREATFEVVTVAVYRWTLPEDTGPAARLVNAVCERSVDAVTFTAAPAVRNFFAIADVAGRRGHVVDVFRRQRVAAVCIGPACAEEAAENGIVAPVLPQVARLGAMVQAYASSVAGRSHRIELAGLDLTIQGRLVLVDGSDPVLLSDRERDVLGMLKRRPGVVVSKPSLLREVWGGGETDEHLAEVAVARLRRRLGPAGRGIETVVRRGYRLSPE